ncbi:MAG: DeoR family transcriptional regulator, partial [Carnobacterium sp.]
MYTTERHKKILNLLNEKGSVSVKELSDFLDFSPATIRSDLN